MTTSPGLAALGQGPPALCTGPELPFEQEVVQDARSSALGTWYTGAERELCLHVNSGNPLPLFKMGVWGWQSPSDKVACGPMEGAAHQLGWSRLRGGQGERGGGQGAHHCPPPLPAQRHTAAGTSGARFIVSSEGGCMGELRAAEILARPRTAASWARPGFHRLGRRSQRGG